MWKDLVGAVRQFIVRDLMYVLGGTTVWSALFLLLAVPNPIFEPLPLYGALFFAGLAYITGFAVQESLSLTPLVTTQIISRGGPLLRFTFERFTRSPWTERDCSRWKEVTGDDIEGQVESGAEHHEEYYP